MIGNEGIPVDVFELNVAFEILPLKLNYLNFASHAKKCYTGSSMLFQHIGL